MNSSICLDTYQRFEHCSPRLGFFFKFVALMFSISARELLITFMLFASARSFFLSLTSKVLQDEHIMQFVGFSGKLINISETFCYQKICLSDTQRHIE